MRKILNWILSILIVAVLVVVGYFGWKQWFAPTETKTAPIPSEEFSSKSKDTYTKGQNLVDKPWSVDETMSTQVLIKSVHLQAPLVSYGNETRNGVPYMKLPTPPEANLYSGLNKPGSTSGVTMIASHVDDGQGYVTPFSNMHKVQKGTPVMVKDASGKEFWYRITEMKLYKHANIPDKYFRKDGKPELVLVTCSGPTLFAGEQPYYLYNLVVTADPLDSKPSDW